LLLLLRSSLFGMQQQVLEENEGVAQQQFLPE
jgi:hypothetical protein